VHSSIEEDHITDRAKTGFLRDYSLLLAYNTIVSEQSTQTFTSNSVLEEDHNSVRAKASLLRDYSVDAMHVQEISFL
jgi:hypothetical protein